MVKIVHAKVPEGATTLQMMQALHKKKKIPIHEMQLWYNNRQLEEDKRLSEYGITEGTNITLKVLSRSGDCPCPDCKRSEQKITLTVTGLSKTIQVECVLGEPVESLKEAIQRKEGISVSRQKLTFKNQTMQDHILLTTFKFDDEENGNAQPPVVTLLIDSGAHTVLGKLRSAFSFKSTAAA